MPRNHIFLFLKIWFSFFVPRLFIFILQRFSNGFKLSGKEQSGFAAGEADDYNKDKRPYKEDIFRRHAAKAETEIENDIGERTHYGVEYPALVAARKGHATHEEHNHYVHLIADGVGFAERVLSCYRKHRRHAEKESKYAIAQHPGF